MEGVTPSYAATRPGRAGRRGLRGPREPFLRPPALSFSPTPWETRKSMKNPRTPGLPSEGVSPGIKIFVLILTLVTIAAFALFFIKLFGKMGGAARAPGPAPWLQVAQALESAGLKEQAAEQYALYLKTAKMDRATRARVSLTLGRLHAGEGDCARALPWLLHAELSAGDAALGDTARGLARKCEAKLLKSPKGGSILLE